MTERVPQVMNTHLSQIRSFPREFPAPVVNAFRRPPPIGENELGMLTPLFVDDPPGDRVEHDDALLTVLGLKLIDHWQDEHAGSKFRNLDLPIPAKLQDLLLATARVHFEQGDALQVARQLAEQSILFFPAQWIRLPLDALLQLDQRRRVQPRHTIVVAPHPGGQVEDPANATQLLIYGAGRYAVRATGPTIAGQGAVVDAVQAQIANVRHDPVECVQVTLEESLLFVIFQELGRCLLKRPCRSDAVDHGVTNLVQAER